MLEKIVVGFASVIAVLFCLWLLMDWDNRVYGKLNKFRYEWCTQHPHETYHEGRSAWECQFILESGLYGR